MIPRHHLHHHIGRPVIVHTPAANYSGMLQTVTPQHALLAGGRPMFASADGDLQLQATHAFGTDVKAYTQAYYGGGYGYGYGGVGWGGNIAIPIAAIIGLTAIGLSGFTW